MPCSRFTGEQPCSDCDSLYEFVKDEGRSAVHTALLALAASASGVATRPGCAPCDRTLTWGAAGACAPCIGRCMCSACAACCQCMWCPLRMDAACRTSGRLQELLRA